jgi:CHAT domain
VARAESRQRSSSGTVHGQSPRIRVRVVQGDIGKIGEAGYVPPGETLPIDAIAVGHYAGVDPRDAELALDRAISSGSSNRTAEDFIITGLTKRGTIRGDLGIPFFLPDPRSAGRRRVIVVAGMGAPGAFGEPELMVLARELCWCLSRMNKRHLASVLIGAGNGSLDLADAAEAWLCGLREGLAELSPGCECLEAVTFVEFNHQRARELNEALRDRAHRVQDLKVHHGAFKRMALAGTRDVPAVGKSGGPAKQGVNYLTVAHSSERWSFALIPPQGAEVRAKVACRKRDVNLRLQRLANASQLAHQLDRGSKLRPYLLPRRLWNSLDKAAPISVVCGDGTIAGVPWEMIAALPTKAPGPFQASAHSRFLGVARGLTRHLQRQPGPSGLEGENRLSILVIADACRERPLEAMRRGAHSLLALFKDFDRWARESGNDLQIDVTPIIGPDRATRARVLKELNRSEPYDLLYYGGHGEYDEDNPSRSGWIFSGGERVSAEDVQRVGGVPKFVFSNACETGRFSTAPQRRHGRHARSFAEVLLDRGVANFVCAAWPIGAKPAAAFAEQLFRNLLGVGGAQGRARMYVAMQAARKQLLESGPDGEESWGAYQHYGDPHFKLFH